SRSCCRWGMACWPPSSGAEPTEPAQQQPGAESGGALALVAVGEPGGARNVQVRPGTAAGELAQEQRRLDGAGLRPAAVRDVGQVRQRGVERVAIVVH